MLSTQQNNDLELAVHEARMAVLARIKEEANAAGGDALAHMAEAFAWLMAPARDHG